MEPSSSNGNPQPNIFANDGSFFDHFRKKMATQSKTSDSPSNPNCIKQRTGFRPKTACKPINLKASFKKQLKSSLAVKSTLETESPPNQQKPFDSDTETTSRNIAEEKSVLKRLKDNSPPHDIDQEATSSEGSSDGTRKRTRRSRWGEMPSPPTNTPPIVTVINGVPVTIPASKDAPQDVTLKALQSLLKTAKNKYEYNSDEEMENGTWEHKQRTAEIQNTITQIQTVNTATEGKHHLGDFLPTQELERFMMQATAIKTGSSRKSRFDDNSDMLTADNVGYKMLAKAGWKAGTGLGANGTGMITPIERGTIKPSGAGLGAIRPGEPLPGDDEFDVYRKRMMLAYKYRPNPMNNPRRAYY